MKDPRFFLALILSRLTQKILCLFSCFGGGSAPGLLALKIDPRFISKQRPLFQAHIVVSGTNGKTTTTRMISAILKANHLSHVHNRSGSNLLRGIASALIKNRSLFKNQTKPLGLWEVDEAVLPHALKSLKPQIVILTNLFRDQLDRYGEIDTLAKKWLLALKKLNKQSLIILNGDDATLIALGKELKKQVVFFGIRDPKIGEKTPAHAADATFCPACLKPFKYDQVFYSHLGKFSCPCGFQQPPLTIKAKQIQQKPQSLIIKGTVNSESFKINLPTIGLFNVYNLLAALAVAQALKLDRQITQTALANFKPVFGRMETIKYQQKIIKLMLVKNPAGFNQVIKTLEREAQKSALVLVAINDKLADGTDVSWLWDVDFEILTKSLKNYLITGNRAWDMAVRLKYANCKPENIQIINTNIRQVLEKALKSKFKQLYILPTYTAMLEIRNILNQWGLVHSSWQD